MPDPSPFRDPQPETSSRIIGDAVERAIGTGPGHAFLFVTGMARDRLAYERFEQLVAVARREQLRAKE